MSEARKSSPRNSRLQELLDPVYADIVRHTRDDFLAQAEKNFYSTRDYALGDTVSCSAEAALENCEQIKSFLDPDAPASAYAHIDAVEDEIRRLAQRGRPFLADKLWLIIILAALAFFIYFVLTHRG